MLSVVVALPLVPSIVVDSREVACPVVTDVVTGAVDCNGVVIPTVVTSSAVAGLWLFVLAL